MLEFWGEYRFTLDDRGRLSVPANFRHEFENGAMLTVSDDGCIELFTKEGHREMEKDVAVLPRTSPEGRQARWRFYGRSLPAELDRQGRILVPQEFRQQAALQGPVVVSGNLECFQIWNPERYRKQREERQASSSEQVEEG
ncbi:MAG: division/cell wall cluster transcriptional repressor MraZ [Gammaproteobacteria bacterium]